jgi:hypothetical protein
VSVSGGLQPATTHSHARVWPVTPIPFHHSTRMAGAAQHPVEFQQMHPYATIVSIAVG